MLSINELQLFSNYCTQNNINVNDWIRFLAYESLQKVEK